MEYYSVVKSTEPSNYKETWRELGCILSEGGQQDKAPRCRLAAARHSGKGGTTETGKEERFPGAGAAVERRSTEVLAAVKLLCDAGIWVHVLVRLSQPRERTTPRA